MFTELGFVEYSKLLHFRNISAIIFVSVNLEPSVLPILITGSFLHLLLLLL